MSAVQPTPTFPGPAPAPAGLTLPQYSTEAALAKQVDHGPVCSRFGCGKPVRLPRHLGGCDCPPRDEDLAVNRTPAQRNLEAMETIARCLLAYCKHQKIALPDADAVTAEMMASPTGVAEVDGVRAKARALREMASA